MKKTKFFILLLVTMFVVTGTFVSADVGIGTFVSVDDNSHPFRGIPNGTRPVVDEDQNYTVVTFANGDVYNMRGNNLEDLLDCMGEPTTIEGHYSTTYPGVYVVEQADC
jgi:hypothetical protein